MRKFLYSIPFIIIVPTVFWLGGYNFDSRGNTAVVCFILTLAHMLISYIILADHRIQ